MLHAVDKLSEILDQSGVVDTIYLDFVKAFDATPHKRLLIKLESYGVKGCVLIFGYKILLRQENRW